MRRMRQKREHKSADARAPLSSGGALVAVVVVVLGGVLGSGACAGARFRGPARLGTAAALTVVAGSTVWVVGERASQPGNVPAVGLVTAAVGMAAAVAAGCWMAARVACQSDPDCDELEECREIPAPPGGVPYKQCMPR